jgi:hypothetical protein
MRHVLLLAVLTLVTTTPAARAAEDKKRDDSDHVYLVMITLDDRSAEALLFDRLDNRQTRLREAAGFNTFDIPGRRKGKVLRITQRDVYFEHAGKRYVMHIGDKLSQALRQPLPEGTGVPVVKRAPAGKLGLAADRVRWDVMLEWLSDRSGMPVVAPSHPTGTLTVIPPVKDGVSGHSLAELVGLLTEHAAGRQFALVRREGSFLLAADGEPAGELRWATVLRVGPEEVVFRIGTNAYTARAGQLLEVSPERRLSADRAKELGIPGANDVPAPGDKREKSIDFKARKLPWRMALEQLADQTGLPVITYMLPTGTFTLEQPEKSDAVTRLATSEVLRVMNEALKSQHLVPIRRQAFITLVDAFDGAQVKVLRVQHGEAVLQRHHRAYLLRPTMSFAEALARPLTRERVEELRIQLDPQPGDPCP